MCAASIPSTRTSKIMCAASIPSTGTSKIMVMKPSDQDGSMTTATVYMGTHSTNNFQPSMVGEMDEVQSQLPNKSHSDESAEIRDDFQENESLIASEDMYRNGVPAYSLLLYKPGSNLSMDNCPADMNPLIITTNGSGGGGGGPCLAEILTSLPQSQVLLTTSPSQVNTRSNQGSTLSSFSTTQNVDPAWLQVLSNILSGSSDRKQMNEPTSGISVMSDSHPVLVSSVGKPYPSQVSGTDVVESCETSQISLGNTTKIPLSDVTNNMSRQQQGQGKSIAVQRGDVFIMSHVSKNLEGHSRSTPPAVHGNPTQAGYLPAFIDKAHADPIQQINLTSSGEESQVASPLKTDTAKDKPMNHDLGTSTMSKLNMPLLGNFPVSSHEGCGGPLRESHNMKERRRRARIKDACNLMRQLVPGMSHKTDKATVFEFSARYIHFLKSFVGSNNDKDFLLKYNPY